MSTSTILLAASVYLGVLFATAYVIDARGHRAAAKLPEAWIYALSLAAYCTTWTYYGSVGRSAHSGYGFLPIYIGPAFVFIAAQPFLHKLLAVSKAQHITSIADLIAARYGKRQSLAGLVTLIAVIGVVPYISLQLKAVSSTFMLLNGAAGTEGSVPLYSDTSLYVALILSVFVIAFGTRRVDATEQHSGLMAAVAFESVVKLLAFLVIGIFVTYGLNDGFSDILGRAAKVPELGKLLDVGRSLGNPGFWTLSFLSGLVIFCLPRQFQVTVVENTNPSHLGKAAWIFPLYLVAINIFVVPIAMFGLLQQGTAADPDVFVLSLPLQAGHSGLGLFAFVGGLAAATGMIIVETIALSTMVSNDLVLPLLIRGSHFGGEGGEGGASGDRIVALVKRVRRMSIVVILLLAFAYVRLIGISYTLVSIGLLSFAAVAQFAPVIIGGLYWKRGNFIGAFTGLAAGFLVWAYTLLVPSFAESGWMAREFIDAGPFGIAMLRPYGLFGLSLLSDLDHVSHGLFWSLLANCCAYVVCSLAFAQTSSEMAQAKAFVDMHASHTPVSRAVSTNLRLHDLASLLTLFLGAERGERVMAGYAEQRKMVLDPDARVDADLLDFVERAMAGSIGSSLARVVVAAAAKERHDSAEAMDLLSNASVQIEVQWARLREAVQNIGQGLSMFDADLKLLVWNQRFLELLDFPESFGAIDTPLEKFIRYNAERGEYGPGDVDELVRERVERARRFEAHVFERERLNGRIIEVSGNPLPHGGFITTYTDITERKRIEFALREAKDELEKRVDERTRALKDSEERFRDFAESSSDWMWETDADLRFSYFSERAAELLARPMETLMGKTRVDLAIPEEVRHGAEKWRQHIDDLAAHRPFRDFEYSVRRADGNVGIIRVNGKPIFAADGSFLGYRGTASDVTELAQAQNRLMEAEKLAALGRLVAGVAHEINTPIGIGVTAASYLREQTRDFGALYRAERMTRGDMQSYLRAAEEASDSILTNLRRAASLVQSFKQVAVDQASEQRRRFRFKEYLEEILDSLRPQLRRTGHVVKVDCPSELELDSFPGALSQVVTNLIMNSLQHGFANIERGQADISVHQRGREVVLAYSDNGCGMSEANAKRIFEPFFTTRRGQGGSGLGMHVVYNLVTQTLKGRIECRTAPGAGMHLEIIIPVDPEFADE